ncbi:18903_t:CDS:2, partial [Gigaspora margarita]
MEKNEENSKKRNINLVDITENSSESEEKYATNSSNQQSSTKKNLDRKEKSHRHYKATCYYCISKKTWAKEKLAKLEAYLANECSNCPENILWYWCEK